MKLDKVMRKFIPSAAKLIYNPIFKHLVNAIDFVPRRIFSEFSNIPPNHLRIRVGVGNRILANHIFYLNEAKDFWPQQFIRGCADWTLMF
jgi:hypothetical protein